MASISSFLAISAPPSYSSSSSSSLPRASFRARANSHFQKRLYSSCRFSVRCSYAEASVKDDFRPDAIDVVADVRTERIVVLGGSGFVGSAICKAAVSKGIEVVSLSRSGRPTDPSSWPDQVTWIKGSAPLKARPVGASREFTRSKMQVDSGYEYTGLFPVSGHFAHFGASYIFGDVFYTNWDEVLVGATAVVSTIGGFGSEEQMKRINGEANVVAVNAAKDYGIPKFILISVHDYNLPSFLLSSGYFTGKRKAESEVLFKYPNSGVVLRPGVIYGKRRVDGFEIPLDLVGEPLERLLSAIENFTKPLSSLPASDLLLAPPISVDDVGLAVINAVTDDDFFGIFTIEQIKEAAEKVRL